MSEMFLKEGDTKPDVELTLRNSDNTVIDLAGATVNFCMTDIEGNLIVDAPMNIVDSVGGEVRYNWTTEDTKDYGPYKAEVTVTYSDGDIETFPSTDPISIYIARKLK